MANMAPNLAHRLMHIRLEKYLPQVSQAVLKHGSAGSFSSNMLQNLHQSQHQSAKRQRSVITACYPHSMLSPQHTIPTACYPHSMLSPQHAIPTACYPHSTLSPQHAIPTAHHAHSRLACSVLRQGKAGRMLI